MSDFVFSHSRQKPDVSGVFCSVKKGISQKCNTRAIGQIVFIVAQQIIVYVFHTTAKRSKSRRWFYCLSPGTLLLTAPN